MVSKGRYHKIAIFQITQISEMILVTKLFFSRFFPLLLTGNPLFSSNANAWLRISRRRPHRAACASRTIARSSMRAIQRRSGATPTDGPKKGRCNQQKPLNKQGLILEKKTKFPGKRILVSWTKNNMNKKQHEKPSRMDLRIMLIIGILWEWQWPFMENTWWRVPDIVSGLVHPSYIYIYK